MSRVYCVNARNGRAVKQVETNRENNQVYSLLGVNVAQGNLRMDDLGVECLFYTFPALAIRCSGKFRLRFTFFNVKTTENAAVVYSDVFPVYSPRNFPGMLGMRSFYGRIYAADDCIGKSGRTPRYTAPKSLYIIN
jgi:Velvet factor